MGKHIFNDRNEKCEKILKDAFSNTKLRTDIPHLSSTMAIAKNRKAEKIMFVTFDNKILQKKEEIEKVACDENIELIVTSPHYALEYTK